MEDYEGDEECKHQGMRIVARNVDFDDLHWRSTSVLHQEILNLHPPLLVVHHPRQISHFLLAQPQQTHHAVDQLLRTAALVQDLLVDQQGYLPEVDWVVELVVYLEEGRELIEGQVVLGWFLLELAEHEWRGVGLLALL